MSPVGRHDENSAWWYILVNAGFNALTVIVVILRWWSRCLTRAGYGWDDGCILVATLLVNGMLLDVGFLVKAGFGVPINKVDKGNIARITELGRIFRLLFLGCICFVKLSALFFYLRVFGTHTLHRHSHSQLVANIDDNGNHADGSRLPILSRIRSSLRSTWRLVMQKPSRRMLYIYIIVVVIMWSIANVVQEFVVCDGERPMCGRQRDADLGVCVFNAGSDLLILILPLWPIWQLQMKRGTKIGLSIVFLLGTVTIVVAFLRFEAIHATKYGGDYNGTAMRSANYAILEPNLAILCISLPMIQPILRLVRGRVNPNNRFENGLTAWRERRWSFPNLFKTSGSTAAASGSGGNSDSKSPASSPAKSSQIGLQVAEPGEIGTCNDARRESLASRIRNLWRARAQRESQNVVVLTTVSVEGSQPRPDQRSFQPLTTTSISSP